MFILTNKYVFTFEIKSVSIKNKSYFIGILDYHKIYFIRQNI